MSIWISILLITICALCWDIGVVLQKQAADVLPKIELGAGLPGVIRAFVTSGKWMGGLAISAAGWGLFAFALNYTPISLARAIQGSGFVILAFFSIFFLDHRLESREWAGVIIVTAGIIALGLSEPAENQTVSLVMPMRLVLAVGVSLALCFILYAARKILNLGFDWVIVFSIFAGVLLGMGDVFTKAVLVELNDKAYVNAFAVIGPALACSYLTGFFILSRGYQHGRAILVTGVSDFCSRLVTIFFGILAMGETFPADALLWGLRTGGLIAILAGTALLARFSGEQLADGIKQEGG